MLIKYDNPERKVNLLCLARASPLLLHLKTSLPRHVCVLIKGGLADVRCSHSVLKDFMAAPPINPQL